MSKEDTQQAYEDLKDAGYDVTYNEVAEALHGARDDYGRDKLKDPEEWWENHHPKGLQKLQEYLDDDDDDDQNSNNSSDSGGGCYIATATLQGAMPVEVLEPLKEWRYAILEKSPFGHRLSSYYRRTAPAIAEEIADMPRTSAFLRNVIVKPAIRLAKRPRNLFNDVLLFALFVIGLSIAEIIKLARR